MSVEKNVNSRIQHKHDTEANWNKAINFIPKIGEIIVYDIDENHNYSRFKIGDGIRTISNLEFSQTDLTGYATESYVNEGLATKQPIGDYALKSEVGGKAIIDVVELPTENIREDVFYRVLTGSFVINQLVQNDWTCYFVETLPTTGEPVFSGDLSDFNVVTVKGYYNVSDSSVMAYVSAELSSMFGVSEGWYPVATLTSAVGHTFSGIITDIMDDPNDGAIRLLLEYMVYNYKNGNWTASHKKIGRVGIGPSAETFNHPSNVASGIVSHAEGYHTTASGDYSHAEGSNTTASGNYSHAEGFDTTASGNYSHSEGYYTTASGNYSHSEGFDTTASGDESHAEGYYTTASGNESHAEGCYTTASGIVSHAEGYYTIAASDYQHVQGKLNIEDSADKYAHIVGNGTSSIARSNAHTLDWGGNAWFAGDVYVGGEDMDSGSKLVTESTVNEVADNAYNQLLQLENLAQSASNIALSSSLTWDGNIGNREFVISKEDDTGVLMLVRVCDEAPVDYLNNPIFVTVAANNSENGIIIATSQYQWESMGSNMHFAFIDEESGIPGLVVLDSDQDVGSDTPIKKGIYFVCLSELVDGQWKTIEYTVAANFYGNSFSKENVINALGYVPAEESSKQDKITGTAGQFVVIGDDGNVTTKTIPNAEEASF